MQGTDMTRTEATAAGMTVMLPGAVTTTIAETCATIGTRATTGDTETTDRDHSIEEMTTAGMSAITPGRHLPSARMARYTRMARSLNPL